MKENNKIINTNPKRFIIAGFLVILFFFGGIGAWSVFFPFQGAVIASGTVKVFGERKVVQHLEGGMFDKIFVQEGDQVYKGDVLIELKSSQVNANVDLLEGRLWAKLAEADRLHAEIKMDSKIEWSKDLFKLKGNREVAEVMAMENDIFHYRVSDMQGKILLYNSQIKQLGNRIDGAREEFKAQEDVIANLNEELQAKRPLFKAKYLGKTDILELERTLSQHKGRKGKLKQDIAEFFQMIQELKLRIVDIQNQYRENAVSRLGEVKDTIFEIKEQIKPYLDAQNRLKIRAPISGEIINLRVTSEKSGVIQPGMPLLDIVPTNTKLIIEAMVRPQDITDVHKGQATKVQLSAFQRRSTPPVPGKVVYISPDLITQRTAGGEISYYVAHIEVHEKDLKEENAYLSPGMPATCYITTEKRSVISYLLSPLLQNVDRAMRE